MMRPSDVSIAATAIRCLRSPWKRQRTRRRPRQKNPARILGAGHLSGQPFLVARAIDEPTDRQARGECDRRHPEGTGLSRWRGLRRRGIHDRTSPFRLQTDFDNMATRAMRLLELDQDGRPTWGYASRRVSLTPSP